MHACRSTLEDPTWHKKSDAQIARVQELVDRIYDRFLDLVSEGRNMPREKVHEIAQGRVWSGTKAKELGLVDELGGLDRAIAIARERADLDDDAPVRYHHEELDFFEQVLQEALREVPDPLSRATSGPLREAFAALERLERMAGTRGVLARLPFDL